MPGAAAKIHALCLSSLSWTKSSSARCLQATETVYQKKSYAHLSEMTALFLVAYRPSSYASCRHMGQTQAWRLAPPHTCRHLSRSSVDRERGIRGASEPNRSTALSGYGTPVAPASTPL